jgi:hypothetical protein
MNKILILGLACAGWEAVYAIVLTYILNFKRFNHFILDKKPD